MRHLGLFKEKFQVPFPDYNKATLFFSTDSKGNT